MSAQSIVETATPQAEHRRWVDVVRSERAKRIFSIPRSSALRTSNRRKLSNLSTPARLNLGCGLNTFAGWTNIDSNRGSDADVILDLRGGLPMKSRSIEMAYSEHMIEHMPRAAARVWLRDLCDSLTADGVVRIATPDLGYVVTKYLSNWRDQAWIQSDPRCTIRSGCEMVNVALRSWGHAYIYDFDDLQHLLVESGFSAVTRVEWGYSSCRELSNRETRPDSKLIVEARL